MLILTLVGEIFFYKSNSISNLAVSALIIIMINPLYIYDIGFQFSFSATIGIILFADNVKEWLKLLRLPNAIIDIITVTIAAQIWLIPLELYHYNRFTICSIFTNALVSFAHSAAIIVGIIMVIIGNISYTLAKPIAIIAKILLKFILVLSEKLAQIPFISIDNIYVATILFQFNICVLTYDLFLMHRAHALCFHFLSTIQSRFYALKKSESINR